LPGGATAVYDTTFHYRYGDWLGSSRFSSTTSRTKFSDDAYAPYGENYAESGTVDPSFTGNDQDTVSGTYDFLFREYNANQGRWISPDTAGLGAVNANNPQTWNRYAYVRNNPLSYKDPLLGLFMLTCQLDGSCAGGGGGEGGGADGGGGFDDPCFFFGLFCGGGPGQPPIGPPNERGGGGRRGGQRPRTPPANNGRNCTVSPATWKQYAAGTVEVAAMMSEFFSGLGQGDLTFAPDSATSQVMAQSGPVQDVLNEYYMTGQTSDLYTFGAPGLVSAGGNPVAQFAGSFRWTITPTNGGINLSLTNTTSFRSLTYDKGPQWQRGNHWYPVPMGNTHQTYNITATCH